MIAYQAMRSWKYACLGVDVLPYQLALGASLRIFEGGVYWRIYIGPLKLHGGFNRMHETTGDPNS